MTIGEYAICLHEAQVAKEHCLRVNGAQDSIGDIEREILRHLETVKVEVHRIVANTLELVGDQVVPCWCVLVAQHHRRLCSIIQCGIYFKDIIVAISSQVTKLRIFSQKFYYLISHYELEPHDGPRSVYSVISPCNHHIIDFEHVTSSYAGMRSTFHI